MSPDTETVTGGHDSAEHLGSLKPPIYETSTFVFSSAEEAKQYFRNAYALDGATGEQEGYIYSRLDSPNLKPAEHRLANWERADDALIFNSGMSAISSVMYAFLRPGDVLLYSAPLYGGTGTLIDKVMAPWGVNARPFRPRRQCFDDIDHDSSVAMVYVETPSNPTNDVFDLAVASAVAKNSGALAGCRQHVSLPDLATPARARCRPVAALCHQIPGWSQ